MHQITGEIRKEPRVLDNGTYIIELSESYKPQNGDREYTNYAFFFKPGSDAMRKWYDSAFKVGKVISVTCDALKVNVREHNGKTYITLQAAGFANLAFSQREAEGQQSAGNNKDWAKQPQQQQRPSQQRAEPPMDFEDDIPF